MKVPRGFIVSGADGMDEVTTTTKTFVIEIKDGKVARDRIICPTSFGISYTTQNQLAVSSSRESADSAWSVIIGTPSPLLDISLLNAACVLYLNLSGKARSIEEGFEQGQRAIATGKTLRLVIALCSRNKKYIKRA